MVDITKWYECIKEQPTKKGKYLLMVGVRDRLAGHTNTGIIEAFWNGQAWDVRPSYVTFKWKYIKPGEKDKYPDFERNGKKTVL